MLLGGGDGRQTDVAVSMPIRVDRSRRSSPPASRRSTSTTRRSRTRLPTRRPFDGPGTSACRRTARSAKSAEVSSSPASGSLRWASKPAEMNSQSGRCASTIGAITSSNAWRYTSPRVPAGNGRLQVRLRRVRAARLGGPARPRVQRRLVRRDVQHPRVVVEDVLGAVAVVHVPVDDGHPLAPSPRASPRRPRRC